MLWIRYKVAIMFYNNDSQVLYDIFEYIVEVEVFPRN